MLTVVVVLAVNEIIYALVLELDSVLNVLEPVKVIVPVADVFVKDRFPYVLPPPAKVIALAAVAPDISIVDVVAVTVRFVEVAQFQIVDAAVLVKLHVPEPIVRVLILLLFDAKVETVTFWLLASNVPVVKVNVFDVIKLSIRLTVPTALITIGCVNVAPAVVIL